MRREDRKTGDRVFVTADNLGDKATIIETRESDARSLASHYKVRTDSGDEFWAFDYEIGELMLRDSTPDTLDHIGKVQSRIAEVCNHLTVRAANHDMSKLAEPEKPGFDVLTFKLAELTYGSDEYRAAIKEAKPTIDHHYQHNDHHPEHWPNGIGDMSLLSIVEMLCDWKAASERTKQGSIAASLVHNKQRFGIDEQLTRILENTVRELGW